MMENFSTANMIGFSIFVVIIILSLDLLCPSTSAFLIRDYR